MGIHLKDKTENKHSQLTDYIHALDVSAIVAITDQKGIIKHANDNFCKISKYSREELLGQDHRIINSGYHPKTYIRNLWRTIARGIIWKGEFRNKAKDGTNYWVNTTVVPFLNEKNKPYQYLSIRWDITKEKIAEENMARMNEMLEENVLKRTTELEQAVKDLDSFSYSVSHDLRAPLRGINGFTRILKEDHEQQLDNEGKRILDQIIISAERMDNLIQELLHFSRAGKKEISKTRVNMTELAQKTFDDAVRNSNNKNIELNLSKLHSAPGDADMLSLVWQNLITNALKFSSKKKKIKIEISSEENEREFIFHIKDNGDGFDMTYAEKLFGVFQRLHNQSEFPGTGVGLAIVSRIISKHGGRVTAEGKKNAGAKFSFILPKKA